MKKADLQLQEAFADVEIAKAIDTIVEGNALRRRRDAPEKERDRTDVQLILAAIRCPLIPVKFVKKSIWLDLMEPQPICKNTKCWSWHASPYAIFNSGLARITQ